MASIDDIKLTKCNIDLVRKDLRRLKLPTEGTLKQVVGQLADYYEASATSKKLTIADCDTCHAGSDATLAACPFCGEAGSVFEDVGDQPEETTQLDNQIEGGDEQVDFEVPQEGEEVKVAGEGNPSEEAAVASKGKNKGSTRSVKAKAPKPAKAVPKEVRAQKAPAPPKEVEEPDDEDEALEGEIVDAPNPEGAGTALVSVEELDRQVEVVRASWKEGAVSMFRMGTAAKAIQDGQLWKLRTGPKGNPLYKSFRDFCAREIEFAPTHVYRAIDAAKNFTEEQVRGLSGRQVRIALQLPSGLAREEVLKAARRGEGTTKLTERANALRGTKPKTTVQPPKQAITVRLPQGRTALPMYKAPSTGGTKVGDTEDAKRAKRLADEPWAVLEIDTKTRMFFRMGTNPKTDELVLNVELRRKEPSI